jgi:hypothetical protein
MRHRQNPPQKPLQGEEYEIEKAEREAQRENATDMPKACSRRRDMRATRS